MPKASTEKKAGSRAKKDPNAPKRALSAFMFYSTAQRDNVKKNNPGIGFGEIGRELGAQWKKLDAAEKAPYEKQAAADKVRAEREKKAYDAISTGPKKSAKKAVTTAPDDEDEDEDED